MSELTRRRNARDLWVSRSHLWAAAASAGIAILLAFLVGTVVGRAAARSERAEQLDGYSDEDLVSLLARIEASGSRAGGAEHLTYPEALTGQPVEIAIPAAPELPGRVDVAPPPLVTMPGVSAPPSTGVGALVLRTADAELARTRLEALVSASLPVWVRVERNAGVDVVEVGVGPWEDQDSGVVATAGQSALMPSELQWIDFDPTEEDL